MRTLYFENTGGATADMFTAAFVDANLVDADVLAEIPRKLNWHVGIHFERVRHGTLQATRLKLLVQSDSYKQSLVDGTSNIGYSSIRSFLTRSDLPYEVKELAQKMLLNLHNANAPLNEQTAVQVILYLSMAATCVVLTAAERYKAKADESWNELHDPTGNFAIMNTIAPQLVGEWPAGRLLQTGYGTADTGMLFRVALLDANVQADYYENDFIYQVSCRLNQESKEHLVLLSNELQKKGVLHISEIGAGSLVFFCESDHLTGLCDYLLASTGASGIRYRQVNRELQKTSPAPAIEPDRPANPYVS